MSILPGRLPLGSLLPYLMTIIVVYRQVSKSSDPTVDVQRSGTATLILFCFTRHLLTRYLHIIHACWSVYVEGIVMCMICSEMLPGHKCAISKSLCPVAGQAFKPIPVKVELRQL